MENQNINEDLEKNTENSEITEENENNEPEKDLDESIEENDDLDDDESFTYTVDNNNISNDYNKDRYNDNEVFTYTVDNDNNINNDYDKDRYNEKKSYMYIFIGLAILILIIVLIVIFVNKSNSKSSKFEDIETQMAQAAEKYYDKNPNLLPQTEETSNTVNYDTLVENNLIKPLSEMTDKNVSCTGNVVVSKSGEEYAYFPSLNCNNTYKSTRLNDKIIESDTVTTGTGLYEINGEYVFRGEYPNNYVSFDGKKWRIIKINNDKSIKMVMIGEKDETTTWDNRYNSESKSYSGINDFRVSRLLEFLNKSYEKNTYVTKKNKKLLVKHSWCIGKLTEKNTEISSLNLCNDTYDMYIGLLTVDEVLTGSVDENCKNIYDGECTNYNYFANFTKTWTLNASSNNTYTAFYVSAGSTMYQRTSSSNAIKPVININSNVLYKSGTGTKENPYTIGE